jgi:hypothetical protein
MVLAQGAFLQAIRVSTGNLATKSVAKPPFLLR